MIPSFIVAVLSMMIFFIMYYFYAMFAKLSLNSPLSMNEYFSGIFFLRNGRGLFWGRVALIVGFPLSYILKFMEDGSGIFYFPLLFTTWLIFLYFFKYAKHLKGNNAQDGFFSILLKGKADGIAGVLLWLLRALYFTSVVYVFLKR